MNIDKGFNADSWMISNPRLANAFISMMRRLLDAMGEDVHAFADYCANIDSRTGTASEYERRLVAGGNALPRDFITKISEDLLEAAGAQVTLEAERLSTVADLRHVATVLNRYIDLTALYEEWVQ